MFAQEGNYQLASTGKRWFAAFIDYGLYFLFLITIAALYGKEVTNEDGSTVREITGLPALLLFSSWFFYLPLLESFTGQSIGKGILGIKVLKQNYSKATYTNCLVRHLFDFADCFLLGGLGVIVASNNNMKQRVGDLVAKTIVVNQK